MFRVFRITEGFGFLWFKEKEAVSTNRISKDGNSK